MSERKYKPETRITFHFSSGMSEAARRETNTIAEWIGDISRMNTAQVEKELEEALIDWRNNLMDCGWGVADGEDA